MNNEQQLKNNFDALLSDAASTFVYIKEKAKMQATFVNINE